MWNIGQSIQPRIQPKMERKTTRNPTRLLQRIEPSWNQLEEANLKIRNGAGKLMGCSGRNSNEFGRNWNSTRYDIRTECQKRTEIQTKDGLLETRMINQKIELLKQHNPTELNTNQAKRRNPNNNNNSNNNNNNSSNKKKLNEQIGRKAQGKGQLKIEQQQQKTNPVRLGHVPNVRLVARERETEIKDWTFLPPLSSSTSSSSSSSSSSSFIFLEKNKKQKTKTKQQNNL